MIVNIFHSNVGIYFPLVNCTSLKNLRYSIELLVRHGESRMSIILCLYSLQNSQLFICGEFIQHLKIRFH